MRQDQQAPCDDADSGISLGGDGDSPPSEKVPDVPREKYNFAQLVEEVGEACYGPNWRNSVAALLGVTPRSIDRWRSGQVALTLEALKEEGYLDKLEEALDHVCPLRRKALHKMVADHGKIAHRARRRVNKLKGK